MAERAGLYGLLRKAMRKIRRGTKRTAEALTVEGRCPTDQSGKVCEMVPARRRKPRGSKAKQGVGPGRNADSEPAVSQRMALWKILQIVNDYSAEDPYKRIRHIIGKELWPGSEECWECSGIGSKPAESYPTLILCSDCDGTGRKQDCGVEPQ